MHVSLLQNVVSDSNSHNGNAEASLFTLNNLEGVVTHDSASGCYVYPRALLSAKNIKNLGL